MSRKNNEQQQSSKSHLPGVVALFASVVVMLAALACTSPTTTSNVSTAGPTTGFGFKKNSSRLQVGFLTVGPTSDFGFNYQHNQGRLTLEAMLRDRVDTVLAENIPENADAERVMQRMSDEGANLIFATSYGYLDSTLRVAQKKPNVIFMHCLGTQQAANVGTYSAALWEPAYVGGMAAAMTAKGKRKFGFVTSYPIPPVFWIINAFTLGAQSVDKEITVETVFTNSWNNPAAETEAVRSLVANKNVAVVYVLVDSPIAGVQTAERAGIYSLAQHADLSSFAPKGWITGSIWGWGKLYVDIAERVMNKTWTNQHVSGGFKEGYVSLAPFGPAVDSAAQKSAREMVDKISSQKFQVFTGPLYDVEGRERVPAGKALTTEDILKLDWVVRGVNGVPTK
jgi:basic membrane lipoprotein Med (substrate-binding protein (PBP1-ABC) superfamily)